MYNKKRANSRSEFLFNKNIVNSKRSQSEIITTVLIILLVLAAVVIVWQVVKSTVQSGADEIKGGSDCVTISLELQDVAVSGSNTDFTIKRNSGGGDLSKIIIIHDGVVNATEIDASSLKELGSITSTGVYPAITSKFEIAAKLGQDSENKICDISDTYTVA